MAVSSPAVGFASKFCGSAGFERAESLADFVTASRPADSTLEVDSASTVPS